MIDAERLRLADRLVEPDTLRGPAPRLNPKDLDNDTDKCGRSDSPLIPATNGVNFALDEASGLPDVENVRSRNACDKEAGPVVTTTIDCPDAIFLTDARSPLGADGEAEPIRI